MLKNKIRMSTLSFASANNDRHPYLTSYYALGRAYVFFRNKDNSTLMTANTKLIVNTTDEPAAAEADRSSATVLR